MILIVLPDIAEDDTRLAAAKAGKEAAIAQIYEAYFSPVYNFVRLRVGDSQIAEDITSEVFIKFIKSLKRDSAPNTSLRGWIFRVARNAIYDYFGREPELPIETLEQWLPSDGDANPEVQAIKTMDIERTRQAMQQLPANQQEVLLLRFEQQLSLQETADIMGKNANAIKALQFRAVNSLRQVLSANKD